MLVNGPFGNLDLAQKQLRPIFPVADQDVTKIRTCAQEATQRGPISSGDLLNRRRAGTFYQAEKMILRKRRGRALLK